jgi:hypothetical protein
VSDTFDGCSNCFWISEVVGRRNIEAVVEGIATRNTGGNIHLCDVVCADVFEVHEQCSEAVAMSRHENILSGEQLRGDSVIPVRKDTSDDVFKAFGARKHIGGKVLITLVVDGMFRA